VTLSNIERYTYLGRWHGRATGDERWGGTTGISSKVVGPGGMAEILKRQDNTLCHAFLKCNQKSKGRRNGSRTVCDQVHCRTVCIPMLWGEWAYPGRV